MECPFLKKISFKKVNQVASDQLDCEEQTEAETAEDQHFDLEEETVELINSSEVNAHQIYYFNSKITPPEKSNNHLVIKFPKQFQTKKMTSYSALSETQQNLCQEQITNQAGLSSCKNIPHILVSKMSMLAAKCEDIFQGQVTLEGENGIYQCELKEKIIKIFREQKVKYFIQMDKAEVRLDDIKDCRGRLWACCKDKKIGLYLKFGSYNKLTCFAKALELNNYQLNSNEEEQRDGEKLALSYSLDSLGFEVERMPIERLLECGNTFDIILFKNKSLMSKVQRLFTNSDYDHVAMILRASNRDVFLLESTSSAGVAIYSMQSLINLPKKKYYIRLGYRPYRGKRKAFEVYRLQQFIKNALGKRYKFDPMYLISSEVKKEDTFFCSQLIASALQEAGIMDKTHQPYKYLPKHFADESLNESVLSGHYAETMILQ